MTFVLADWSITRTTGAIRYIGDAHAGVSPSYATCIEFHRALQDFADNETSSGDDQLAMIDQTPSDRGGVDTNISLLNGFNIDQTASEHLYDGSITQADGDEIYDGVVNFGSAASIQLLQSGARLTNDFWNETEMVAVTADATRNISHRFMVLVRTAGADIDGRRLIGTQRIFQTVNTEFSINGTERGNNVLALNALSDLNNQSSAAAIALFTDIVNDKEGYSPIDADGNAVNEFYYSNWELGVRSKNDFYERMKWLTREGSAETLYGLPGDVFRGITHEIDIDTPTGTFVEPESVSWPGGTGQLLAIDSTTVGTKMWIQLLSGIAPTDNQLITGNGLATALVNITVTSRTVSVPFVGASTGSAIIGAFGFGIGADDLAVADLLTDLTNTPRQPPNNVTRTITGLVSGEDRILVTNNLAGDIDFAQLSLNTLLNGVAETAVVVTTTIPTDTPTSGQIAIELASGNYRFVAYTSYTGSTFTIAATDFSGDVAAATNNVFIAYVNELATGTSAAFTQVYSSDRTFFLRRRDGGVTPTKDFETTFVGGAANVSTSVQRLSDA